MHYAPEQSQTEICPNCASPNFENVDLCRACGAPLTSHAATDPLRSLFAEGFALRQATSNPRKLIVVIGMWLWLGPVIVMLLFAIVGAAVFVVVERPQPSDTFLTNVFGVLLSALFLLLLGTILYKTTKNYLASRKASATCPPAADKRPRPLT